MHAYTHSLQARSCVLCTRSKRSMGTNAYSCKPFRHAGKLTTPFVP
uniref:Uncharacterized protein n=1 Tax=Triticum urartu TaxID=4572 RepID=A0A8R7UKB2_TRIUA